MKVVVLISKDVNGKLKLNNLHIEVFDTDVASTITTHAGGASEYIIVIW